MREEGENADTDIYAKNRCIFSISRIFCGIISCVFPDPSLTAHEHDANASGNVHFEWVSSLASAVESVDSKARTL